MNRHISILAAALSLQLGLVSCNAPLNLTAQVRPGDATVRASLVATSSGQALRVVELSQLPEGLRNATEIRAVMDNSNNTYAVQRNADGSLSIPLPAGRQPGSDGLVEVLLTDTQTRSWLVRFDTGPLLKLAASALQIAPRAQVVLGTRVDLSANFVTPPSNAADYTFNWSVATASGGPFQSISGNGPQIRWEPTQAGNYFVRIEMRDNRTGASSAYTSPAPAIFVQAPDSIVRTTPVNGQILAGDTIELEAQIPELAGQDVNYLWSFSVSPLAPFQPIAGQGSRISWEPPAAGSYYLRLQVPRGTDSDVYVSSKPLVLVSAADDVVRTEPASGEVTRGQALRLNANVPTPPAGARYLWSYAQSPQGPFTAIATEGASISWLPESTGEFYLRVRVLAPNNGEEKVYTTSKVVASVRDSDDNFRLTPSPANLVRGQSVTLALAELPAGRNINWYWAPSPQGPFQAIAGQGQNVRWTPPLAGAFYLRAELTGGAQANATLTSASALVSVSESGSVIQASPEGSVRMGGQVRLSANIPEVPAGAEYAWSYGPSPVGPWLPIQGFDANPLASTIGWLPGQEGSFYVKVDVTRTDTQSVVSFVSPRALVFVNGSREFFQTRPNPAVIGTQGAAELSLIFDPPAGDTYTYVWSAGLSPQGPFNSLGASQQSRFTWLQPGRTGNYHIKVDVIANSSRRAVSFVSSDPLVQVGESQSSPGGF